MEASIYLRGTEEITRAANRMQEASDGMQSAASVIDESLRGHRLYMEEWICRLEEIISKGSAK